MHIRQVHPEEKSLVADVLSSAAVNLAEKGNALWGVAEVNEAAVKDHVRAGMYYVAFDDEGPVGVFRFQLEDRLFWPEVPDDSSAFVHKIAVYPHKQGRDVAQALLHYACELTRKHGRRFLRLDCIGGRPKLRAVYERFGFRHHSVKNLGDRVFDRFELEIGAADA
jgi:GNAT superfamily N-acetyltransferase